MAEEEMLETISDVEVAIRYVNSKYGGTRLNNVKDFKNSILGVISDYVSISLEDLLKELK